MQILDDNITELLKNQYIDGSCLDCGIEICFFFFCVYFACNNMQDELLDI